MAFFTSIIGLVDVFRSSSSSEQSNVALRVDRDPQTVISGNVGCARQQYDRYNLVMTTARREMPGSRSLEQQASRVMDLAERAQQAPCTNFMPDIARGILHVMNELLLYAEYEAGHPIFRFMRDMGREANGLEGKMQALQVLVEVSFP
ncbi:hypothetical protein AX14_013086 [Amanita brunnescens Koide BX004]|nr:hypothetical protein AX14_013086 [Amanita brunnescens Koide BX004]